MKVRVLVEQRANLGSGRGHLASGETYDLDNAWARELLNLGVAEPVAEPAPKRAEKRPTQSPDKETR